MKPRSGRTGLPAKMNCAQARETARHVLAEHHASDALVADVLTVVSELVSNAIRHAAGVTGFHITVGAGQVTIEVSDGSALQPHLRPPSPNTPGGFGWRVVKTLAPSTFIRFHRTGKTIVATLPTHAGPPPAP
ncbi:ATP-binding protein [Streptomyces sp. NPDC091204]|uniref:ATP-binding protein n=1 Tax=Streptomyces sp. NPDC091204 TaxID=3155299 RepID=UPI00343FF025